MAHEADTFHTGFAGMPWLVHKFGGTSLATADCFLIVAEILEKQLGMNNDPLEPHPNGNNNNNSGNGVRLAAVVSAMGGKPKTTDLLLDSIKAAAERNQEQVEEKLSYILHKHTVCLGSLFPDTAAECEGDNDDNIERERLLQVIRGDIEDIRDILKTVALMKWQAERISELVSGYGELWSAQILSALMQKRMRQRRADMTGSDVDVDFSFADHSFVYLDARRVITVDEDAIMNGAVVWELSQSKLEAVYAEEAAKHNDASKTMHFVITGYVASNTQNVATTLQRDGSDYSAAIMGRLLTAISIDIWTDVDGVMTADPRRVPLAQVMSEVSYNEAMELAYFGAKVIHPKTMQPAISASPQIPIYIRNTFNSKSRGTRIYTSSTTHTDRDKVVCGFSSIENMALINVEGSGLIGVPGVAKRLFSTLERIGVNVVLISQASSEHSVTFATTEVQAMAAKEAIEEEFSRELKQSRISAVDIQAPCSIIAAVGDGMSETMGVSGRFFSAFGDAKINVLAIAQGCSERNISAVVRTAQSTRALRAVHAAFRLSHTTIRVCIIGMNELGDSLLRLLDEQRESLKSTFDLDLQVCVVLPNGDSTKIVRLQKDDDGSDDSITIGAFHSVAESALLLGPPAAQTSFLDEGKLATLCPGDLSTISEHLLREECSDHILFDCTNHEAVGNWHAKWLRSSINVVTANNTGLSGSHEQRNDIRAAEKAHGKQSAKYLREVTVGGGLPIISTLRSLLHSGDRIMRIDGIMSVSLSYIMFRISPPPDMTACSEYDSKSCNGAFRGDLTASPEVKVGAACSFSRAVKEAVALGLMEVDPTKDLNNEYSSRVLMVLARELGFDQDVNTDDIQKSSDKLLESILDGEVDYLNFPPEADSLVQERVDAARSRRCVLRHIASVDVKSRGLEIRIEEVPEHHIFAVTPPSCNCVRFFTHRHRKYPLVVQGPSAGADSTASALLAEVLQLMRGKANPRSVALSRTDSSVAIQRTLSKGSNMDQMVN
jgi:aspartokinase/homoserine dehydrogenase 1